mgnify:FL=1
MHAPTNAEKLSLVQEWMQAAKTVYIWDGISEDVILPHGDYVSQALHIKELAQLGKDSGLFPPLVYIKVISLPKQARYKYGEISPKVTVYAQV